MVEQGSGELSDREKFWQSLTPEEQAVMREAREIFGEGFQLVEVEWK